MIDLQDPWFELLIEEDVEAKDLEAHRVLDIIWLAGTVSVSQLWLNSADSLDDN